MHGWRENLVIKNNESSVDNHYRKASCVTSSEHLLARSVLRRGVMLVKIVCLWNNSINT